MPTMPKQIEASKSPLSADGPVEFTGVKLANLPGVWPEVYPLLSRALDEGQTLVDVSKALIAQDAQLWIAASPFNVEAACVTEIITKGTRKYCNIWLCAGSGINNWIGFLSVIEAWASENNCDAMMIEGGRTGWRRFLTDYKIKKITLAKEL